jgi:hypothetical protein
MDEMQLEKFYFGEDHIHLESKKNYYTLVVRYGDVKLMF